MVVERNRMSCVNKKALDKIIDEYWHRYAKGEYMQSAAWYAAFLLSWTVRCALARVGRVISHLLILINVILHLQHVDSELLRFGPQRDN